MEIKNDDDIEEGDANIQYGYRKSWRRTSYEYRGSSSLTPAQIMEQETYYTRAACRGGISVMVGVSGLSKTLVLTRLFFPRGKIEVSDSQGESLHKILYQAYNMSILLKFVDMSTNFKSVYLSICQFFPPN